MTYIKGGILSAKQLNKLSASSGGIEFIGTLSCYLSETINLPSKNNTTIEMESFYLNSEEITLKDLQDMNIRFAVLESYLAPIAPASINTNIINNDIGISITNYTEEAVEFSPYNTEIKLALFK